MAKPMFISIQKLFAVIITLKIVSSILGWLAGYPWTLGFFIPLGLMAVYIFIGVNRADEYELSDEKFADSCYYLGFIFTISSILVSLFDLSQIGTRLNDVAVRFGAAMVSTVLGLIARVYLVNFKMEPHDVTRFMEQDLLDSAKTFRIHMELAVEKLKQFNIIVEEASKAAVTSINKSLEDAADAHTGKFRELLDQMSTDNRKASDEAVARIKGISEEMGQMLARNSGSLSTSLRQFESRLAELSAALDTMANSATRASIDKINKTIEDLSVGYHRKFSELFEEMALKNRQTADEAVRRIAVLSENAAGAVGGYSAAITSSMKQFEERLAETAESLNHRLKNVARIEEEINRTVYEPMNALSANVTDTVGKHSAAMVSAMKQFEDSLVQTTGSLNRKIEHVSRVEHDLRKAIHEPIGDLSRNVTEIVGRYSETLASSMKRFEERLAETADSLTDRLKNVSRVEEDIRKAVQEPINAMSENISSAVGHQMEAMVSSMKRFEDRLAETTKSLKDRLHGASRVEEEITRSLQEPIIALSENVSATIGKHSSSIVSKMMLFEERLVEIAESLNHRLKNVSHIEDDIKAAIHSPMKALSADMAAMMDSHSAILSSSVKQFEARLAEIAESLDQRFANLAAVEKGARKVVHAPAGALPAAVSAEAGYSPDPASSGKHSGKQTDESPATPGAEAAKPVKDPIGKLRESVNALTSEVNEIVGDIKIGAKKFSMTLDAVAVPAAAPSAKLSPKSAAKDPEEAFDKLSAIVQKLDELQ